MTKAGRIIILNGTSSSGKSTLARALQITLDEPYLHADSDAFWGMVPDGYFDVDEQEYSRRGDRLLLGCFRAVVALSSAGANVIFDVVFDMPSFVEKAAEVFGPHKPLLVSVYCPLETLIARGKERGDREIGLADGQFSILYDNSAYDLRVDTARYSPEECAEQIRDYLQASHKAHAIERLTPTATASSS